MIWSYFGSILPFLAKPLRARSFTGRGWVVVRVIKLFKYFYNVSGDDIMKRNLTKFGSKGVT